MKRLACIVVYLALASDLASADGDPTPRPTPRSLADAERECKAGDATACTRAGDLYTDAAYSHKSQPTDGQRAIELYQRGCDLGDIAGCGGVGWYAMSARDYKKGMPILEKACGAGDMSSCTLIADQIAPGAGVARDRGVKEDFARALKLYEAACAVATTDEGCTSGCNSLGSIHYYGKTHPSSNARVTSDRVQAAKYYEKACAVGCLNSCNTLGDMSRDGDGIPADLVRAAAVYQKGCDGRFAPSCAALSELYAAGTGVTKNPAKAKKLMKRACTLSRNQVTGCEKP
jgi:TPR repeat protein